MRIWICTLTMAVLAATSVFVGVANVEFSEIFMSGTLSNNVILLSRFPRTLSIIISGFGMGICGLIMQQITMNKFVSPTTAGTADGAKLGILIAMLVFPAATIMQKTTIAVIFALITTWIFIFIMNRIDVKDKMLIPLIGLMTGTIVNSITNFFAYRSDLIQNVNSWLFGSFSGIVSGNYELLYISIPLITVAFLYSKYFTIVGMGESFSKNLGINYKKIVNTGILIVCIVASLVISTIGSIPFLGLVVPNIITMMFGDNLEKNIFITGIFGSIFLLICDIFSRMVIFPYEIPIGMVVGIIGSGIFLYMIIRREYFEK